MRGAIPPRPHKSSHRGDFYLCLCYEFGYEVTYRHVTSSGKRIGGKEDEHNQSLSTARNLPQDDFIKHSCGVTASRGKGPEAALVLRFIKRPECRREETAGSHSLNCKPESVQSSSLLNTAARYREE